MSSSFTAFARSMPCKLQVTLTCLTSSGPALRRLKLRFFSVATCGGHWVNGRSPRKLRSRIDGRHSTNSDLVSTSGTCCVFVRYRWGASCLERSRPHRLFSRMRSPQRSMPTPSTREAHPKNQGHVQGSATAIPPRPARTKEAKPDHTPPCNVSLPIALTCPVPAPLWSRKGWLWRGAGA